MENLTSLEKTLYARLDLRRFWAIQTELESSYRHHGLAKYDVFQAVRLRFYDDGSIAHTYQELGDFYGCSPEYARNIVERGMGRTFYYYRKLAERQDHRTFQYS